MTDPAILNGDTIKKLIAAVGKARFIRLAAIFMEETKSRLERIRKLALDADIDDFKALQREAHSLKGSAATYGAEALSETARNLEESCIGGDREKARKIIGDLIGQVEETLAEMVAFTAGNY
jgi:HPt (histidine-containing phosphotransfer) domain-containing protein